MSDSKAHTSKGQNVTKTFRKIPYVQFADILKKDGEAFLEDINKEAPLKRQTIWKACKKLTEMVGKKIKYNSAVMHLGEEILEGYQFTVVHDEEP